MLTVAGMTFENVPDGSEVEAFCDWMKTPDDGGFVAEPPTLPPSITLPVMTIGPLPRS